MNTRPSQDDDDDDDHGTSTTAETDTAADTSTGTSTDSDAAADTTNADPTRPDLARSNDMTSHDVRAETTSTATRPDQPLHDPLPYGTGFTDPQTFGYGVSPAYSRFLESEPTPGESTTVARRERSGSPVLAVAGLLSLGVAVWAILGAPVLTTTVVITAALVLLVLVGLAMVVRR